MDMMLFLKFPYKFKVSDILEILFTINNSMKEKLKLWIMNINGPNPNFVDTLLMIYLLHHSTLLLKLKELEEDKEN